MGHFRLSEYLMGCMAQLEEDWDKRGYDDPIENRALLKQYTDGLARYLLTTKYDFSGAKFAHVEDALRASAPGFIEGLFDDYFTADMLKRIPKMVSRAMKLKSLVPRTLPSPATNLYLMEATRSYIFGFWYGSVAFSRVAIEQGIFEVTEDRTGFHGKKLSDLIKAAVQWNVLDTPRIELATKV